MSKAGTYTMWSTFQTSNFSGCPDLACKHKTRVKVYGNEEQTSLQYGHTLHTSNIYEQGWDLYKVEHLSELQF